MINTAVLVSISVVSLGSRGSGDIRVVALSSHGSESRVHHGRRRYGRATAQCSDRGGIVASRGRCGCVVVASALKLRGAVGRVAPGDSRQVLLVVWPLRLHRAAPIVHLVRRREGLVVEVGCTLLRVGRAAPSTNLACWTDLDEARDKLLGYPRREISIPGWSTTRPSSGVNGLHLRFLTRSRSVGLGPMSCLALHGYIVDGPW